MANILLIEDDPTLGMTLELSLSDSGHQVTWCRMLEPAKQTIRKGLPDLIILDLGLPDGDGLTFCRSYRKEGYITPILIVTARTTLDARIQGLTVGADDYVTKPFELSELLVRVEALLRRQQWHRPGEQVRVGMLRVDFNRREAFRGEELVPLTDLELRLLRYLVDHAGEVVPRGDILTQVWGLAPTTRTRTVDVFISRLRRVVEEDSAHPKTLLNVRGIGYRLRLKPESSVSSSE